MAMSVTVRSRPPGLVEAELGELGPSRVRLALVGVFRARRVEIGAADRAQPRALLAAQDLLGKREGQRVAGPGMEIERVMLDIRRAQLVPLRTRLGNLPGVDGERRR